MTISLETLLALAAVNPYRWEGLTQDELDARIEAAGLRPFLVYYPNPGPSTRPGPTCPGLRGLNPPHLPKPLIQFTP